MQKSNESELNSLVHHTMSDIHKIYNKYRNIETKTQNTTIVILLNREKKEEGWTGISRIQAEVVCGTNEEQLSLS